VEDPILRNNKWYQSLVRSFKQEKNNIQAEQKKKMVKSSSESTSDDLQNKNLSVTKTEASDSTILSKPTIKFVKTVDRPAERPTTDKVKNAKKPAVKYAKMYRRTSKSPNACYNCGDFDHLSYDCCKWMEMGKPMPKNNTHQSMPPRTIFHKTGRSPTRINRTHVNSARPQTTQDLMIILIQRFKRREKELKARTLIHTVDRGRSRSVMAWVHKKV
nr:hypothetical protein [Tanacetum cinerariifolium]